MINNFLRANGSRMRTVQVLLAASLDRALTDRSARRASGVPLNISFLGKRIIWACNVNYSRVREVLERPRARAYLNGLYLSN